VISQNTQRRLEAYFRREWSYALDRALHFTSLPDGEVTPEFARRLAELTRARLG
jgi:hypothetical protein